jgi:hypothetical protein
LLQIAFRIRRPTQSAVYLGSTDQDLYPWPSLDSFVEKHQGAIILSPLKQVACIID